MKTEDIEFQKLQLEEKKNENEFKIKEAELALRREEFKARINFEEKSNSKKGFSPVFATILGALLGFLGTGVAAYIQGSSSIQLERLKFESSLIAKALEPEEVEKRAEQLDFYIKIGLLKDKTLIEGIKPYVANPSRIPQVLASGSSRALPKSSFILAKYVTKVSENISSPIAVGDTVQASVILNVRQGNPNSGIGFRDWSVVSILPEATRLKVNGILDYQGIRILEVEALQ